MDPTKERTISRYRFPPRTLDGHAETLSLTVLGYVLLNGVPQCQTTATPLNSTNGTISPNTSGLPAGTNSNGTTVTNNALWTGRGLDDYSPNYSIDSP
jgi:hypothetical protein